MIATKMVNPFMNPPDQLISISTGMHASLETQNDLTCVKQIGENALQECLEQEGDKLSVKLHTFDTSQSKRKSSVTSHSSTPEINLLQRVSQVIVGGGEVDLHELVGKHECANMPPALFDSNGSLRHGNKSSLVKILMDEAGVCSSSDIPADEKDTILIVDAMHVIHKWSFHPGETFQDVQRRYLRNIMINVPPNTSSIHICCDRYDHSPSLKSLERKRRKKPTMKKLYDIQSHLQTPVFRDFVSADDNKAALMCFLSEKWSSTSQYSIPLYLSGGFTDQTVTMVVTDEPKVAPELSSRYEEADMRIMKHAQYVADVLGAERIVVHANDTDVIVLCIYFCKKTSNTSGALGPNRFGCIHTHS